MTSEGIVTNGETDRRLGDSYDTEESEEFMNDEVE